MIQFEYSCRWHPRVTTVARALSLVLLLTSLSAAQTRESKHVLILMQEDVSSSVYRVIDENARISLHAGSPEGVLISSEHLDRNHFPVPEIQAEQVAWIKKKYANSGLDLIITVGDVPTDLFPGVPLVTLSADPRRRPPSRTTPATAYASVWVALEAQKTLELALRLQPGARRIMVIGDGSPPEDSTLTRLQQMYPTRIGNTPITYVANPVVSEISHRVSELGSDNIVLFTALTQDGHGHPLISTDAMARIAAASGAPVYAILDTHIGTGAVGGYVTSFAEVGKAGGQLGLRLLAGERPKDIEAPNVFEFDSRQLRRWKIPESSLPAGSVVLFRQPSIWETYRWYIIGGALLCLLQAVLILGLLWQRSTRRHAEASLIERLAFERLLSDLSKIFINLPEEQVDTTIEQSLPRIAEFLRIDRITVHEFPGKVRIRALDHMAKRRRAACAGDRDEQAALLVDQPFSSW